MATWSVRGCASCRPRCQKKVLDPDAYGPLEGSQSRRVGEWEHKGRRLIVVWCPKRARKDAHERRKAVERLLDKLARSSNPKEMLSNHGTKRFIAVAGDARLTVNPEKIAEAERWGRADRCHHQSARRGRGRSAVALPRALAGRGELPHHQARSPGTTDLALDPGPHPRPHRPSPSWPSPASATSPTASPSRSAGCPPEAIRSALVHRQCSILRCQQSANRYRRPLEADARGGTNLRNHGAAPDHHPLPARLTPNEPRTGAEAPPDVVPSQK